MSDIEQHCVSLIIKRIVGCDDDKAIEAAAMIDRYYTAPGATTKSDGGAKAGSSPILASKEEQRTRAHGVMPVGDNADASGCTGVGPSDPSPTRSDPNEQAYADLIASGGIFPEVYQQSEPSMNDDQIKYMVDRFLMWKLPEHFNPDCGISFDSTYRSEHGPVGTNLFDAVQATAMVRHMLDGIPSSTRSEVTVETLKYAEKAFDQIRLTLIKHLDEPARSAFWQAVEGREVCKAALLETHQIRKKS